MNFQCSPADDAAGDFHEGLTDECETFEADAQSSKVVKPRDGSLDDPAGFAQPAAVRLATSGDFSGKAGDVYRVAVFVALVSPVALYDARL